LLDGAEGGTVGYTWLLGFSLFFLFTFWSVIIGDIGGGRP
jgi:hypothetical protein